MRTDYRNFLCLLAHSLADRISFPAFDAALPEALRFCWYNDPFVLMVQAILRVYSYVFHLLLSLLFLGLGTVGALSPNITFQTELLPWSGKELVTWLFALGLLGLLSLFLAVRGTLRFVFVLWALVVVVLMARAIFASGYQFSGTGDFGWALAILAAALLTVLGAISRARQRTGRI